MFPCFKKYFYYKILTESLPSLSGKTSSAPLKGGRHKKNTGSDLMMFFLKLR